MDSRSWNARSRSISSGWNPAVCRARRPSSVAGSALCIAGGQASQRMRAGRLQSGEGDLSGISLAGADLRKPTSPMPIFRARNLSGANLSGALDGRRGARQCRASEALLEDVQCDSASLKNVSMIGVRGARATFNRSDLSSADLDAASFEEAQFTSANLTQASLREAVLDRANLAAPCERRAGGRHIASRREPDQRHSCRRQFRNVEYRRRADGPQCDGRRGD